MFGKHPLLALDHTPRTFQFNRPNYYWHMMSKCMNIYSELQVNNKLKDVLIKIVLLLNMKSMIWCSRKYLVFVENVKSNFLVHISLLRNNTYHIQLKVLIL